MASARTPKKSRTAPAVVRCAGVNTDASLDGRPESSQEHAAERTTAGVSNTTAQPRVRITGCTVDPDQGFDLAPMLRR